MSKNVIPFDRASLEKALSELLTIKQLCKMFRVSEMTVYTWKRYRGLPVITVPGDARPAIRFLPEEVRQWAKREGIAVPTARAREHFRKVERRRLAA